MLLTPYDRRRSSRRWLWSAAAVVVLIAGFGLLAKSGVQDPMPADWLSPAHAGHVIRRDSILYFAYPIAAAVALLIGAVLSRIEPLRSGRMAPLPARAAFLLVAMCGNIAVLSWLRPNVFSAWLAAVYVSLLLGLIVNHFRAAPRPPAPTDAAQAAPSTTGQDT